MPPPHASRPHMPDYGIQGPDERSGLLPWSWAEERLTASRNYWVTSLWPDGRPHSMPVWGVRDGEALWFSSGRRSRKARNLAVDPRCVATTEDATEPVVIEGRADVAQGRDAIARVADLMNAKYGGITVEFLVAHATIRVRPCWAFGIAHDDFTGSPHPQGLRLTARQTGRGARMRASMAFENATFGSAASRQKQRSGPRCPALSLSDERQERPACSRVAWKGEARAPACISLTRWLPFAKRQCRRSEPRWSRRVRCAGRPGR